MVILKGRIFPSILTKKSLAEFPYINNFRNGLNTGGTSSRLAWYCSWGDAAVLSEASHTYPRQFGKLTCCLWDSNISRGTTLRSTKASYTQNNCSRAAPLSVDMPMLPKRHRCVSAGAHIPPLTLRSCLWNNSRRNQHKHHVNTKRSKKPSQQKQQRSFIKGR